MRTTKKEILAYFTIKVLEETDNCLLWPYRKTPSGYGLLYESGKDKLAHRLALINHTGQPPKDKPFVLHKPLICHNPSCFNYRHLYWGNHLDNMRDRITDGTDNRGERQGQSKLTTKQVLAIRADTRLQKIIAVDYNVTPMNISLIKNRKSWSWL